MREFVDVPLADLTTLRLGGPARRLVVASTEEELLGVVRAADRAGQDLLVLGGGSNLVVGDAGVGGTVVAVGHRGTQEVAVGDLGTDLTVAAGEPWDAVVERTVGSGLAGLEALSGIPGLVGATPIQNVGAYGQEVASTVVAVRVLDRVTGSVRSLGPTECGFSYRSSRLKEQPGRFVVLAVTFRLTRSTWSAPVGYLELAHALEVSVGGRAPLAEVRAAVLGLRRAKGMVLDPDDPDTASVGSFFLNPVVDAALAADLPDPAPRWPMPDGRVKVSAAWLIEQAGFSRGYGEGPVGISTKHTLALTNRGGASTEDLLRLARQVRDGVRSRFGLQLAAEPVLVGCAL